MSDELRVLNQIKSLLELIAEPKIAERDAALREKIKKAIGNSEKKARAVHLMDGSLTQKEIADRSTLDQSDCSKLIKRLRNDGVLEADAIALKIPLPQDFPHDN